MAKYCKCDNFYNIDVFEKGARIRFKELPIKSLNELGTIIDEKFKIKSTLFRVEQTGEISIVIELDKLPGKYFSPSLFVAINPSELENTSTNDDEKTLNNLIKEINRLKSENSYLRSLFNHSLNNNFEE